jgi:hypothetical protein
MAYLSFAVTYDYDSGEGEGATTLGYFGDPVEGYHFFLQVALVLVAAVVTAPVVITAIAAASAVVSVVSHCSLI